MTKKHEFALFFPDLPAHNVASFITIADKDLVKRMIHILRMQEGDVCILFDAQQQIRVRLTKMSKNTITGEVVDNIELKPLTPVITCLLPLLKRDDLEAALYACVELGANKVQLVLSEKVQRSWGGAKEFERLERIMIAAAEQSKNFMLPTLHGPLELADALSAIKEKSYKIFFDVDGKDANLVMHDVVQEQPAEIMICVGPEGDLAQEEKDMLATHGFVFCKLTPTVLRAVTAHAVGLGMLRSIS